MSDIYITITSKHEIETTTSVPVVDVPHRQSSRNQNTSTQSSSKTRVNHRNVADSVSSSHGSSSASRDRPRVTIRQPTEHFRSTGNVIGPDRKGQSSTMDPFARAKLNPGFFASAPRSPDADLDPLEEELLAWVEKDIRDADEYFSEIEASSDGSIQGEHTKSTSSPFRKPESFERKRQHGLPTGGSEWRSAVTKKNPALKADLDKLDRELLEELETLSEVEIGRKDSLQSERSNTTSLLSSKPENLGRAPPQSFSTGANLPYTRNIPTNKVSTVSSMSGKTKTSIPFESEASSSKTSQASQSTGGKNVWYPSKTGPVLSTSKDHLKPPIEQVQDKQFSANPYTVYANIIEVPGGPSYSQLKQPAGCCFVKLLRRAKGFVNLRSAKDRLVVCQPESEQSLGSLLAPPPGTTRFDVQLVVCGVLRRNAASPYELYHFFCQNGFFEHLFMPPSYDQWAAQRLEATKRRSSFYYEGIRVGLEGNMDFLRTIFQQWCDAWHDWRVNRPIKVDNKLHR